MAHGPRLPDHLLAGLEPLSTLTYKVRRARRNYKSYVVVMLGFEPCYQQPFVMMIGTTFISFVG